MLESVIDLITVVIHSRSALQLATCGLCSAAKDRASFVIIYLRDQHSHQAGSRLPSGRTCTGSIASAPDGALSAARAPERLPSPCRAGRRRLTHISVVSGPTMLAEAKNNLAVFQWLIENDVCGPARRVPPQFPPPISGRSAARRITHSMWCAVIDNSVRDSSVP